VSGRGRIFTPGLGGGPLTFPLTGAPRRGAPRPKSDPFLTLFGGALKGRPEQGRIFTPRGGGSAHLSAYPIAKLGWRSTSGSMRKSSDARGSDEGVALDLGGGLFVCLFAASRN